MGIEYKDFLQKYAQQKLKEYIEKVKVLQKGMRNNAGYNVPSRIYRI
ncbi:MAG: hypothetical protein VX642_12435 [Bdellovibrionota bacterium]|nr:hypothetical protein [Bdellovibrionota bacterium]